MCSQYCYVVEDGAGLCGYVVATPDVKEYQRKWKEEWMPRMHKKYPKPKTDKKEAMTVSQVSISIEQGQVCPLYAQVASRVRYVLSLISIVFFLVISCV